MVKPTCRECHGAHFPSEPCERPADRLPSLPPTATTTTRDILFSWALAGGIALGALVAGAAEALIDGAGILAGSLAAVLVWAGCFAWGWGRDRRAERKARAEDAAAAERWRTLLASGAVGDLASLHRAIEEGARETVGQCGGIAAVGPDGSLLPPDIVRTQGNPPMPGDVPAGAAESAGPTMVFAASGLYVRNSDGRTYRPATAAEAVEWNRIHPDILMRVPEDAPVAPAPTEGDDPHA